MRLKHSLIAWHWSTFGDIFKKKKELQDRVQQLELELQQGQMEAVHKQWEQTRSELCEMEKWETELLCHQARMNWAKEGDRNSKFYHAVIKDKKKRQIMQNRKENEIVTTDPLEIGDLTQQHFSTLFTASPFYLNPLLFEGIQPRITTDDNESFSTAPSVDEVREAIKSMKPVCWEIIQHDLYALIWDYFKGAYIPEEIGAMTLVLIPKVSIA